MKVKIGDKVYDGSKEPIMLILTQIDKDNINSMANNATKYAMFPDDIMSEKDRKLWMKE